VPATGIPAPPATALKVSGSPLLLEKVGPAVILRGAPLVYEIIARNITNAPLYNVRVEDELPPGIQFMQAEPRPEVMGTRLSWNVGALDPGAERRYRVELMPSSVGEINSCAAATFSTSSCLHTSVTQPHLVLKKTGPETVVVGDPAVFELELTNDGTGAATGVILYDILPPGLQHQHGNSVENEIGTLAPGETKRITLETRAIQPGPQLNRAKAAGQGVEACAEATVNVVAPGLTLRKDGPHSRFVNREAEFDLEVFNPGSAAAMNVQVTDQLPAGLDFVSATDAGVYDAGSRTVTWNVGTLPPGQRRAMHLKVVGKTLGDYVNRAFARADRNLEAHAEEQLHIEGVAALMLEVVDLDDPVEVGNESVYEVHVINTGSAPTTHLQIVAVAPEGMVPRGGTGPTQARVQGQQVIFEPMERLAAKAEVTFRVRVLCQTPGDWRFRAYMTADQLRSPVLEEESTRIYKE
jgi:uncharacterized repeat protein (TIGR01451 family)